MAEDAHEGETMEREVKKEALDIESRIKDAMRSRVTHFKEQADSLTFEKVRRLLEEDMGMEKYSLDAQKTFIKRCLLESLNGAEDGSKCADKSAGKKNLLKENKAGAESLKGVSSKKATKGSKSEDEEKREDSPVMGLLKPETERTEGSGDKELNESTVEKAMRKRASYIKTNSEKITMAELRRLLEEDLGIDKFSLDPYKKFISSQLDKVLKSSEAYESATEDKKKSVKKNVESKASKKISSEESSDASGSESEDLEDEEEKPKKKNVSRGKIQNSEGSIKRKGPATKTKIPGKKRIKSSREVSEEKSGAEDSGVSEDDHSQSSAEKPTKKKEVSAPAYGKRVEHLKSVIKSCGMSVPPSIYKRVKQASENKREACLIKELEGILSKEGLSANPSEKEIKELKRRKERAKELEGIDMSNIVTSSRRRSTASYIAPPKPKVEVPTDGDDAGDSDDGDEDDDDNDDEEQEEEEEEEDGGNDDSQSEEMNEDNEDDDSD